VGAADPSPHVAGRDLGDVLELGRRLRLKVDSDPAKFLRKAKATVAFVSTRSSAKDVVPLVLALVKKGMNVITTCEELAFPTPASAAKFREIDKAAKAKKVSVLATGVNPGFAMDALALALTAPCSSVSRVSVTRVVDAATRRLPLQRKVGAGLSLAQFRHAISDGLVRHVGLVESAHMIAAGLGWKLDRVDETVDAAIAPRDLETPFLRVPAGSVAGIRQAARAFRGGQLAISLDLQMYVGAEAPRDHILIDAAPPVDATIAGGLAGDLATAAVAVNAVPRLLAAPAGMLTMLDVPLVRSFSEGDLKAALGTRKR
jgi:4-hydroxy-tetrahydrodipicolinate reductase